MRHVRLACAISFCVPFALVACGLDDSATGSSSSTPDNGLDASMDRDAEIDASPDASNDAAHDAPSDMDAQQDASPDAPSDSGMMDVQQDAPPPGPCDGVLAGHVAVLFSAPAAHDPGYVGFADWTDYPPASGLTDVPWADPRSGCVAAATDQQAVTCDFGAAPSGTKIRFIVGIHAMPTSPATSWFSSDDGGTFAVAGSYIACLGTEAAGSVSDADQAFQGILMKSDESDSSNLMVTVP